MPTPIPPQLPSLGPFDAEESQSDLAALLDGVSEIRAPLVPGALCLYGSETFPVVVGRVRSYRPDSMRVPNTIHAPVVAAGRWQAGRIVALADDRYFSHSRLISMDTGRLIVNALHWTSGGSATRPRIGVAGALALRAWLEEAGHDVVEISLTPDSLATVDVVALVMRNQTIPEIEALLAFVRDGGGLVTAVTGWVWASEHPDLDLVTDYAGNRLLTPVGIRWSNARLTSTSARGLAVDVSPADLTHTGTALDALQAYESGKRMLTDAETGQALSSLALASNCLSPDDTLLAPRLSTLVQSHALGSLWPSAGQPVGEDEAAARFHSLLFGLVQNSIPAESVQAHPAAADFPGPVPDSAPRIARDLTIDTAIPRWHSTGLYAAPGELVSIMVPSEVAAAGGFQVRVGAHSDRLWHLPEWTRMPEISRRFPISETKTQVANAFGGLIYVEVPDDANMGRVIVRIEGAVEAPLFVLGETDPDAWRNEIRYAPAPWAEIAGRNMIVTTVSSEVRGLDDPVAVAEAWDRALDLSAELAGWPSPERSSPERFVVDRQIAAGYMHAGYPIMAHLDQQANLVDADHLRSECNWGFYHEVGHNHQNEDWTFAGVLEVTVNLFTLYIYEHLCDIPVAENERGSAAFRASQMATYDFNEPDFEQWKSEPFLALVMYEQLQQAFGWDAYRQVFATSRDLTKYQRPRSDDEKRDQWLVRFSQQVGRNLGPFFEAWGVPTSQQARASVADLPVWLPTDFHQTLGLSHSRRELKLRRRFPRDLDNHKHYLTGLELSSVAGLQGDHRWTTGRPSLDYRATINSNMVLSTAGLGPPFPTNQNLVARGASHRQNEGPPTH